ncbi:MAG TPA: glycosyltransferase family 39 protein [Dyella sp.]|uniref:ArnT family glycosyltransferase n=1 Tax=Dyella sp. TaxID=1869338 RepID=UPI002B5C319C|nr:glycosyltransferase family 39 protein [Dyella sp.]HTV84842.1 glycosyltransferase family 39 protein [Dyella sp.]
MLPSSNVHSTRSSWLWLIALGLLLGFGFQGTRGLWSPDEGRYVDAALQMLDSGHYMAPAYSPDEVNFSKPPSTYWIIAASIKLLGRNEWAARAPYALAFVLTLLLLGAMGRRVVPDKPWLPGLIYGCSAFPFVAANIVSTDAFLVLSEAVAMLGFLNAAFGEDGIQRKRNVLLMWLGFGLAFLTKGPPGLIPLLAVIPFIARRDGWRGLGRFFHPLGLALFLLVGASWYLVVIARYPGLLHYFLHQEVYNRLFTHAHHRNAGALGWIIAYLPTLALGLLPWWPGVISGLFCLASAQTRRTWIAQHSIELFLLLWFFIPFVVFCLAQSRLPLYILPLFLPLSLLLALTLRDRVNLRGIGQRALLGAWIAVLLAAKAYGAYALHPSKDDRQASAELAAIARGQPYAALAFVQNTDYSYTIEEETPWGARMYLGKPVYGIPWQAAQGPAALCHALRSAGSTLVVVDPYLKAENILQRIQPLCAPRRVVPVGSWRKRELELIQM